jgi:capsular polysaccharide export protein
MSGTVLILSPGLWRLRDEVAELTGLTPVRGLVMAPRTAAIAGWGHKPTAARARKLARSRGVPYLAIEDGFLRSVKPGPEMCSLSFVLDRSGIYYDARQASDLETLIETGGFTRNLLSRAAGLIERLRELRLSKYNAAPDGGMPAQPYLLVIDQTAGDASIEGGLASAQSFETMVGHALEAAKQSGSRVVAKLHPETLTGLKRGFLGDLVSNPDVTVVAHPVNPWKLVEGAARVYTVSSQLGFEAVLAGREVHCFGAPFYAGWGLTHDHAETARRRRRATKEEVFAAAYLVYSRYFDAWTRRPIEAEAAIEQLAFLRERYLGNRTPVIFHRVPAWKRRPLSRLLDGPVAPPRHARNLSRTLAEARRCDAAIAAWGKTANAIRDPVREQGVALISIEDGFLRSAGLGAAFTPSLSYNLDRKGIYYDPARESDLEALLQNGEVSDQLLQRAQALRQQILAQDLSKYNLAPQGELPPVPEGRRKILVVGQVADDEAVLKSLAGDCGNVNELLLQWVRRDQPQAAILYKPHPDVERLGRAGRIGEAELARLCDAVLRDAPIGAAIGVADEVAVFTSLAGFEALLRGKPVRTYGSPFYAGWGLTRDAGDFPRRSRRLSLDELVAISLIAYPHYLDPVSGLPCPVEVAIARLLELRGRKPGYRDRMAHLLGRAVILLRRLRA